MGAPTGYSVLTYGELVNCEPRMSAFAQAIREAVTPGCTVIDIGAGPGIFSILACKYGAGRVIAIEPDDSVELLRRFAEANECADRIEIFQGLSTDYSPVKRADVIVSDLRGTLPLFEGHITTIDDARRRLLAPGGKLIGSQDRLRLAVVDSAKTYEPYQRPWVENQFGIDFSAGHDFVVHNWCKVNLDPGQLLCEPQDLATLDYTRISDPNLASRVELIPHRAGTAHGLLIWFDAELAPGIGFSNAPGEPPQLYGQTFLPLDRAIEVAPGDRIDAEVKANLVDGAYVWSWSASVYRAGLSKPEMISSHSSFRAKVVAPQSLRSRSSGFAPAAQPAHKIDQFCLSLIDGRRTLAELAERLSAEFPDQFPHAADSLDYVVKLTQRYD